MALGQIGIIFEEYDGALVKDIVVPANRAEHSFD